jgi:hypothetical protein
MTQGGFANYTGNQLQLFIFNRLVAKGYARIDKKHFAAAKYLDQPVFCPQYPIGKGIYGTQLFCDFVLFHPQKHPKCLIIESKWQASTGSVDEKFPYLVANIKECYPYVAIVVLDGGGYKKEAEAWLRTQVDTKLIGGDEHG